MKNVPIRAAAEGMPASKLKPFDYEAAFQSLESLVNRAQSCAQVVDVLLDNLDNRKVERGCITVCVTELRAVLFMSNMAFKAADDLETLWLEHHNAGCDAARAA